MKHSYVSDLVSVTNNSMLVSYPGISFSLFCAHAVPLCYGKIPCLI
ncbi:MAG: hypothetical protein GQF41_2543 [Candidatus Rifleibacterium amylolyticum]|nr:MAG: hypothetical protein GQF41_2543 [Candidatus Rifleibacterium amylolyticum]